MALFRSEAFCRSILNIILQKSPLKFFRGLFQFNFMSYFMLPPPCDQLFCGPI